MDTLTGRTIDHYEIRESVRKSELFGVYKAFDSNLKRYVLLKTIQHSGEYSAEKRRFFLAEAKVLARLDHPNIARVLDSGEVDGNLYVVSEYFEGRVLSDFLTGPISWEQAVKIIMPIAHALTYAHAHNILHQDLKPDNVTIESDYRPILSDFRLTRMIEDEETHDLSVTTIGLISPDYVSPEQGQGLNVDERTDIYSLGVIFYEMVTGRKMFHGSSDMEIVLKHVTAEPPRPRVIVRGLPRRIEAIILKCLVKNPDKRYQSMEEFIAALNSFIHSTRQDMRAVRQQRMVFGGLGLLGLILIGIISVLLWDGGLRVTPSPVHTDETAGTLSMATNILATSGTPEMTTTAEMLPTETSMFTGSTESVLPGTALPPMTTALEVGNVASLQEVGRWGIPVINQFVFANDDQILLAATSSGVYYFGASDLGARFFFDTPGVLTSLTVSKDRRRIATGDTLGNVNIWSVASGKKELHLQPEGVKSITSLSFAPDGMSLVFSDEGKNIYLWTQGQSQPLKFKRSHTLRINKVLFSNRGDRIYSASDDFHVTIWSAMGDILDSLNANQKVSDISISSNDQYMAAALSDSMLKVWELSTQKLVKDIHDAALATDFTSIVFLPSSDIFITGSTDGYIRRWNIFDKESIWKSPAATLSTDPTWANGVRSLVVAEKEARFLAMFDDGLVEVWDLANDQKITSRDLSSHAVERMEISPNDKILAYQKGDDEVVLLLLGNSTQSAVVPGTLPHGLPISWESDKILVRKSSPKTLGLYNLSTTLPKEQFTFYNYPLNGTVSFSADGSMVVAYANGSFSYWATSSGRELMSGFPSTLANCKILERQDKRFIAAGSPIGVIFNADNRDHFCQASGNARMISETFLPDGSVVAQALPNRTVNVWILDNSSEKLVLKTQASGDVMDVAVSSDGRLLAVALDDGSLEIFDLQDSAVPLKTLKLSNESVNQVLFSNDRKFLIAGLADGTLRIFAIHP